MEHIREWKQDLADHAAGETGHFLFAVFLFCFFSVSIQTNYSTFR